MGYYLQTPTHFNKAAQLARMHSGEVLTEPPLTFGLIPEGKALIIVVENPMFEAALFAHDEYEFTDTVQAGPHDPRPRTYALIDRDIAERESGFNR